MHPNSIIALFLSVFAHLAFFKFMHGKQTMESLSVKPENIRIEIHRREAFALSKAPSVFASTYAKATADKNATGKKKATVKKSLSTKTTVDKMLPIVSEKGNVSKVYTLPETQEAFLSAEGYVHPDYPRKARISRQEGTLLVQIEVKDGILLKTEVTESSGHTLLDETALKAIQKWQFRPVTVAFVQRITFQLN